MTLKHVKFTFKNNYNEKKVKGDFTQREFEERRKGWDAF